MAILENQASVIEGGFKKEIEVGAMDLMMDVLQKYQYQFPVKSTIRELVSNSLDSISERDTALKILDGSVVVSDYYEDREGEVYKDSRFDPNYYDPKWLSDDPSVYVTYFEGKNLERDYIEIKDNGVGLGKYRLEKYFNLGYSTKRLSKRALGKFGLGNKAPLSIGMGYYTVESRYNGLKFKFNVYSGKVESLIPKFNLQTGKPNIEYMLPNGYLLYCEPTEEKNGVSIFIDSKKFHKDQYTDAVQSQLLYFDNVEYSIVHEDGRKEEIDYKADIIYEDDYIILSDTEYYSKPHLLLNRVNYGYVNFDELELENKVGNIGIKVAPEDVEVSPSRESLIWSETTKAMVLQRFNDVVGVATELVQEELKETDFLRWLKTCYSLTSTYRGDRANGSVVERLSCIIDMSSIKPRFNGTKVKLHPRMFRFLRMERTTLLKTVKANKKINKVERMEVESTNNFLHLPVIVSSSRSNNRKDKYLLSLYPNGFLKIRAPYWTTEEYKELHGNTDPVTFLTRDLLKEENIEEVRKAYQANDPEYLWDLLCNSKDVIQYESIEVPDSFKGSNDEEDEEEDTSITEEEKAFSNLSNEERRKLEGKLVLMTPRWKRDVKFQTPFFEWQKLEVPVKEIGDWDESEIYYGNDADSETLQLVTFLTRDTRMPHPLLCRDEDTINYYSGIEAGRDYGVYPADAYRCTHFFENPEIKIIKVSQQTTKYYRDFLHINKFFGRVENNTFTMSSILIKWNTARQIKAELYKLNFLWNYPFSSEKRETFRKLVEYVKVNYREMAGFEDRNIAPQAIQDLESHLDKVQQFQMFVQENKNPEDISKLAQEMWGTPTIQDACAIDMELYTEFKSLLEWAQPISTMFNEMPILTGIASLNSQTSTAQYQGRSECVIPEQLEHTLLGYIKSKSLT